MINLQFNKIVLVEEVNNDYEKRTIYLDVLKALSAFLIIIYHFSESGFFEFGYNPVHSYIPGIGKVLLGLSACSVPLFFMINGILTLDKNYSIKKIFFKVISIIKIYLIWGLIISCSLNIENFKFESIWNTFRFNLGWFWFLKTLAFLYIFNYIFNHFPNKQILGKIIIFLLLIFPFGTNLIWVFIIFFHPNIPLPSWGLTGFFTLYSIVYYLAPIYFFRNLYWVWNVLLIIVGLSLNTFEVFVYSNTFHNLQDNVNAFFPTIGTLFMTFGVFNIFRNINNHSNNFANFIRWIGRNSLGIYLFHEPFIFLIRKIIPSSLNFIEGISICIFILLITTIISSSLKSSKSLAWLLKI